MPELPDIRLYVRALEARIIGARLDELLIRTPFLLRTVSPAPAELVGQTVVEVHRIGKRIVIALEGERFVVIHLMLAGRLAWTLPGGRAPGKRALALAVFGTGTLAFTEAGTKRRASIHLVSGASNLAAFDRGGLEVDRATPAQFAAAMRRENHTLKRALTDPRILDGIGNAYSDEILHRARLSPLQLTSRLDDATLQRLHEACIGVVDEWTRRLSDEAGANFPQRVTAFRPEMAVHGRFRQPCPVCATPVQRIRYAENETDYCPTCQTGGRLLADRGLSRLLKGDWPRSLAELEDRLGR